jgi:uncharacterized protein (TIGR00251 family)
MARIAVKVHPRARRTALTGKLGDTWKLDVAAPPEDGKANDECLRFFADVMSIPRTRVHLAAGAASRTKIVDIEGTEQARVEELLSNLR